MVLVLFISPSLIKPLHFIFLEHHCSDYYGNKQQITHEIKHCPVCEFHFCQFYLYPDTRKSNHTIYFSLPVSIAEDTKTPFNRIQSYHERGPP